MMPTVLKSIFFAPKLELKDKPATAEDKSVLASAD
jgi:hypothetical protein